MTVNRRYSAEGVEKAEHLYCCSDHSLRGVTELTGVPAKTLRRWSGKNGWGEKKSEIGRMLIEIRTPQEDHRSGINPVSSGTDPAPKWFHSGINPVSFRRHSGAVKAA